MNLIPWRNKKQSNEPRELSPYVTGFRSEMDKLFERFFGENLPLASEGWNAFSGFTPTVDVSETEREILVRAEIPGVDPKDLDISLSGHILTLSGEKREEKEDKGRDFYHSERRFGSFRRSIELPETADLEEITAEHTAGVLKVHISKMAGSAPKKISVHTK